MAVRNGYGRAMGYGVAWPIFFFGGGTKTTTTTTPPPPKKKNALGYYCRRTNFAGDFINSRYDVRGPMVGGGFISKPSLLVKWIKKGWRCRLQKLEGNKCPPKIPPEWNEYIPKKNRHSESVSRIPGARDKAKQARTNRRREGNKTKSE